jgi:hypothetical protein
MWKFGSGWREKEEASGERRRREEGGAPGRSFWRAERVQNPIPAGSPSLRLTFRVWRLAPRRYG